MECEKNECSYDIGENTLGMSERSLMMYVSGPQPRLPFPTEIINIRGVDVEFYVIPEKDKNSVLKYLYEFNDMPDLDDVMYDLHTGKSFVVRDFKVTREGECNFLVTPYYAEEGGTVLDWVKSLD